MSQSIFHVRPLDTGKGWAIDEYDGRGAWQSTYRNNAKGEPLDKQEAQRRVFQLRRKAVNSAPAAEPVNKLPEPCAEMLTSVDVHALIKRAHQHWYGIGWPEDAMPVALLQRAMDLLSTPPEECEPLKDSTGCDV